MTKPIVPKPFTRWCNAFQRGEFKFWRCAETIDHMQSKAHGFSKESFKFARLDSNLMGTSFYLSSIQSSPFIMKSMGMGNRITISSFSLYLDY